MITVSELHFPFGTEGFVFLLGFGLNRYPILMPCRDILSPITQFYYPTDEKIIPSGEAYVCHDVGEENTKQRHQPCVKTTTSK